MPGGFYHVVLRGNGRLPIFFDPDDRRRWESYLHAGLRRYRHRVHAYCWMNNHVHLAIQAGTAPLSQFMSFVASQYARSTNKKINRSGHLFERRYRANLINTDQYLLQVVRYIHLNPLRAGIVDQLADYAWSSHAGYSGGPRPFWLTLDNVLSMFATDVERARKRYCEYMQQQPAESILHQIRSGVSDDNLVLDDETQQHQESESLDARSVSTRDLDALVQSVCEQYGVTEVDLASRSRARAYARVRARIALAALEQGIATVTEVARRFGRSQPALSRALNRLRVRRD